MNVRRLLTDPNLFGSHFTELETWDAWIVVLLVLFGEPLDADQRRIFTEYTGRQYSRNLSLKEVWLAIGRRGGKSKIVALVAVVLALFHDYSDKLSPGEIGHVMVIAVDRKQAKIVLRYVQAFIDSSPLLRRHVLKTTAETIELDNNIHIGVYSCSLRSVRGYTVVAAICDEIAFWRSDDSANPDVEILNAIRPAMSTIPNAMLICLSSPYARRGALWEAYREHYGQHSKDVLVWQASTRAMNPTIPCEFLDREQRRDPAAYRSEYEAEFRSDIASALDPEWIDAALTEPNLNRPRSPHQRPYRAFADMSGGRSDAATVAIAHMEPDDDTVFVDAMARFTPPFSPESVVKQIADLCCQYGVREISGDNYAADLVVELFSKAGLAYQRADLSASDIYRQTLPLFSTGRVTAPDNAVLRRELLALERRTRSSGKDLITHPPGAHDDLANAVCGSMHYARRSRLQDFDIHVVPSPFRYDGALAPDDWSYDL